MQWVPKCDTLHQLIRENRESENIALNDEHKRMLRLAPDFDTLTLLQKLECFEFALSKTSGADLRRLLWIKSPSSEVWLVRRTNYTRSLAVMSMVGYILGLGDRHPSNLMLHRRTGKLVHIDFGDCFEVAQHREKYPEKIPFRLTRMLVKAMGVSGIEGTFRGACENVMRVLRVHRDSVMAMLEAFLYDPLINWRLLGVADSATSGDVKKKNNKKKKTAKDKTDDDDLSAAMKRSSVVRKISTMSTKQSGVAAAIATRTDTSAPAVSKVSTLPPSVGDADERMTTPTSVEDEEKNSEDEDDENISDFRRGRAVPTPSKAGGGVKRREDGVGEVASVHRATNVAASLRVLKSLASLAESVRLKEGGKNGSTIRESKAGVVGSMAQSSRMSLRKALDQEGPPPGETLNKRAVQAIQRVRDKLSGWDFGKDRRLDVDEQVERLIQQATSRKNLCQCYIGWCPFW